MKITINQIFQFVCEYYEFDISGKKRDRKYTYARSYFYYLCYKYSNDCFSIREICKIAGIKQHGTVLNGLNSIDELKTYDKRRFFELNALESKFRSEFPIHEIDYTFNIDTVDVLKLKKRITNLLCVNESLENKNYNLQTYKVKYKNLTELNVCLNQRYGDK